MAAAIGTPHSGSVIKLPRAVPTVKVLERRNRRAELMAIPMMSNPINTSATPRTLPRSPNGGAKKAGATRKSR